MKVELSKEGIKILEGGIQTELVDLLLEQVVQQTSIALTNKDIPLMSSIKRSFECFVGQLDYQIRETRGDKMEESFEDYKKRTCELCRKGIKLEVQ